MQNVLYKKEPLPIIQQERCQIISQKDKELTNLAAALNPTEIINTHPRIVPLHIKLNSQFNTVRQNNLKDIFKN